MIVWVWSPHWVPAKYDGAWVEFPVYEEACYEDPTWGVNPDLAHDCGKPRGPIWKVSWSGLKDKWPGAYRALENFQTDNEEQAAMIAAVELDNIPIEEVVAKWMVDNEERWKSWLAD